MAHAALHRPNARRLAALNAALACAAITACGIGARPEPFSGQPHASPQLQAAWLQAQPCEQSAVPRISDLKNFKYGCFCGAGHPGIGPKDPYTLRSLSDKEIDALVLQHYRLDPYDDIDAACRAHDVCWTMHRGPHAKCNDELGGRLTALYDAFNAEFRAAKYNERIVAANRTAPRCTSLLISMAQSEFFMPATPPGTQVLVMPAILLSLAVLPLTESNLPDVVPTPVPGAAASKQPERCDLADNLVGPDQLLISDQLRPPRFPPPPQPALRRKDR